jgi:hypothetical protein
MSHSRVSSSTSKPVSGRSVARWPIERRIAFAADLIDGRTAFSEFTEKQVCTALGIPREAVRRFRRALVGVSLAKARHDKAVDRLVDRILDERNGGRLLERFDEITAASIAAE